jgi:hypothetical protein
MSIYGRFADAAIAGSMGSPTIPAPKPPKSVKRPEDFSDNSRAAISRVPNTEQASQPTSV